MGAISGLKPARLIPCSRWAENVWRNNTATGLKAQVQVLIEARLSRREQK